MNERDGLYLQHILAAITDIESFMLTQDRDGFLAARKPPAVQPTSCAASVNRPH